MRLSIQDIYSQDKVELAKANESPASYTVIKIGIFYLYKKISEK
ncbi:hypothetical protein DCCM_3834 [Desulfocucumis palustris]|uniref:Uncharacterized protein n=1 Tax=Desulfocucumis palustris TaxID=1898651 RepID=A0A2L2XFB8_9FIRM|nr:hypothetical protein DCCM_3834 [Desulfocucumis palustris]